jgi:hypothetical protein
MEKTVNLRSSIYSVRERRKRRAFERFRRALHLSVSALSGFGLFTLSAGTAHWWLTIAYSEPTAFARLVAVASAACVTSGLSALLAWAALVRMIDRVERRAERELRQIDEDVTAVRYAGLEHFRPGTKNFPNRRDVAMAPARLELWRVVWLGRLLIRPERESEMVGRADSIRKEILAGTRRWWGAVGIDPHGPSD